MRGILGTPEVFVGSGGGAAFDCFGRGGAAVDFWGGKGGAALDCCGSGGATLDFREGKGGGATLDFRGTAGADLA